MPNAPSRRPFDRRPKSAEEIAAAAETTPADAAAAVTRWRRVVPPDGRALLDAETDA